jgi:hypothetical protein
LLALSKSAKLKGEVTTVVVQAASQPGNAEGLAGCPANEEVDFAILVPLNCCEVAVQRNLGIVMLKDSPLELLDLREECGFPAHVVPSGCGGLNAAAYGSVPHADVRLTSATRSGLTRYVRSTS